MNKKRCAIYTRKSTEEGLDQEFNSLDAQREACEAFVTSQRELGWKVLNTRYDDGGLSGGTMERPALQDLLTDIVASRIDVVLVYKIDRLTRSLADFSKIVELFDQNEVSFVSVTQQFNTTTSMGRLTLNVLLSFAQFEREVTAERIRDKIAASKKKGIWMGGPPPLGYDAVNKMLVPNQQEAETVRWLFARFMDLKSITKLKGEADRRGIVSKVRLRPSSRHQYGGKPISRGSLTLMLRNPIYIGKISHQGELYPGADDAIVCPEIWKDVQRHLDGNGRKYAPGSVDRVHRPLAGFVFDESGDQMNVVRVKKGASMFRYYVSNRLCRGPRTDDAALRAPAPRLESAVLACIRSHLRSPSDLVEMHGLSDLPILSQRQVLDAASKVADLLSSKDNLEECPWGLIAKAITRITVCQGHFLVTVRSTGLLKALGAYEEFDPSALMPEQQIELKAPLIVAKRGQAARLMIANDSDQPEAKNQSLIKLVAQAHHRFQLLATGKVSSPGEIAAQERTDPSELSRTLQLACLAPDIVKAILLGRQPADLTATKLKKLKNLPICWEEQRLLLGFAG